MSKHEREAPQDILVLIVKDEGLQKKLQEFDEDVSADIFLNTRRATFVALVLNFLNSFHDIDRSEEKELIDTAQQLGFEPKKFRRIVRRNPSFLLDFDSERPYVKYTLDGYYAFLNYASYFLDTAALDNKEFGKAAFPKTTRLTAEEFQKTAAKGNLLLAVRKSLTIDKTGFSALGILAEERIAEEVQTLGEEDPQKLSGHIRGINIFIHDYQHLFSSLATQTATSGVEIASI